MGSLVPRTDFHDFGMKADRMGREAATTPNVRSTNVQVWRWTKFPAVVNDEVGNSFLGRITHIKYPWKASLVQFA